MQLQRIEGLRGRGALELNLQLCDQTHCETHERDGARIQSEQRKIHRWSYGHQNHSTTVGIVFKKGLAVLPTGGAFPHLPHHLDLASEDSVGHSTGMSVLTLTLTLTQTALSRCCYGRWGTAESPTHSPSTRLHVL